MESSIKKGVLIVYLEGDLVGEITLEEVRQDVLYYLEQGTKNVVLNLQKVTFLNSAGITLLLVIARQVKNHEGNIALCCLSPRAKNLINLLKLHETFWVFNQEESAIEGLAFLSGEVA